MTAVLGVDPSLTRSGCALVTWHPGTDFPGPSWATWEGRASKPEVENAATMRRRIRVMLQQILAPVPVRLDLSVIEGPSMGSRHAGLADERSGLRWMLIDQLCARGPVVVITPGKRAVLAAGHGRAGKPDVLAAVRAMVPDARVPNHDVADAVALAAAGAYHLGLPMPYGAKQEAAFQRVVWPEVRS